MKKIKLTAVLTAFTLMISGCTRIDNLTLPEEETEQTAEQTTEEIATEENEAEEITTEAITEEPFIFPDTRAGEILASMTLEEKVGQMFLVRCPKENQGEIAAEHNIGGYVMFKTDFADAENSSEMKAIVDGWQEQAKYGLIIATDEEGGDVTPVSSNDQYRLLPFSSQRYLYETGGLSLIDADAHEKAVLLSKVGVNLNLAPVCDLSDNPGDYIYYRSAAGDAETAQEIIATIVERFQKDSVGCTLKHFPGYGANPDTHTGISVDSRDKEQFRSADFLPFEAGIEAGAEAVMMSHNIVTCMDNALPVSLSPAAHELLREELGFTGVIITDDLAMEALAQYADDKGALAVMAVKAGNDLLCTDTCEEEIPAVIEAVKKGEISENQINTSVLRILEMKLKLGIIE